MTAKLPPYGRRLVDRVIAGEVIRTVRVHHGPHAIRTAGEEPQLPSSGSIAVPTDRPPNTVKWPVFGADVILLVPDIASDDAARLTKVLLAHSATRVTAVEPGGAYRCHRPGERKHARNASTGA